MEKFNENLNFLLLSILIAGWGVGCSSSFANFPGFGGGRSPCSPWRRHCLAPPLNPPIPGGKLSLGGIPPGASVEKSLIELVNSLAARIYDYAQNGDDLAGSRSLNRCMLVTHSGLSRLIPPRALSRPTLPPLTLRQADLPFIFALFY